jgi:hypothetical protein
MTKLPIVLVTACAMLLTGVRATAQSKPNPLQGVWQTVEATTTGPGARTIVFPEPGSKIISPHAGVADGDGVGSTR